MLNMQNVKDIEITEGNVRTIHDKDSRLIWGRVAYNTKYAGDTIQNGTPTPDTPIPVQVVTGEQTVTISDGVDSEDFTISLGTIELCKIGDYQDYIYKSGDDWYVHKECMNRILDSSSEWGVQGYGGYTYISGYNQHYFDDASTDASNITVKSSQFTPVSWNNRTLNIQNSIYINLATPSRPRLEIRNVEWASVSDVVTWFTAHPATVYYVLATPTDTKITDSTLIGQLNAVHEWLTRYGYNATVAGNLPIIISKTNL